VCLQEIRAMASRSPDDLRTSSGAKGLVTASLGRTRAAPGRQVFASWDAATRCCGRIGRMAREKSRHPVLHPLEDKICVRIGVLPRLREIPCASRPFPFVCSRPVFDGQRRLDVARARPGAPTPACRRSERHERRRRIASRYGVRGRRVPAASRVRIRVLTASGTFGYGARIRTAHRPEHESAAWSAKGISPAPTLSATPRSAICETARG